MGGGQSREEKQAQEDLRRQQQQQIALQNQLITVAQQEDPLETRLRSRDMAWLNFEDSTGADRDVSKAPLGPALGLYDRAVNNQQGERMGIGALRMGLNESNPMLGQLLEQQSKDRRQQDAAGDLENAVRMKSAEVNRSAMPLAGMAQDRRMGLASLASNNANSTTGNYLQFLSRPRRRSFWQDMLLTGWGNASSAARSGMGGAG